MFLLAPRPRAPGRFAERFFRLEALARRAGVVLVLGAAAPLGCSNTQPSCTAPGAGSFTIDLHYAQTIPVDLLCDAGDIDASSCGARPHPFEGASWSLAVNGGTGTVKGSGASWTCSALSPRSSPTTTPDGSPVPGTGCYLALECGPQAVGDAGTALVQIQLLTPASTDVVVLVHDIAGECCTDEYTGSWR